MSALMDEKYSIEHTENGEVLNKDDGHHHLTQQEMKHGDNALKYIGEERIEVTVEDVSYCLSPAIVFRRLTPMGLLFADPCQQPILSPGLRQRHCTTSLATVFLLSYR